ncbi:MAG: hypothetical protein ACLRWL_09965 [Evtepia gabavorous]
MADRVDAGERGLFRDLPEGCASIL